MKKSDLKLLVISDFHPKVFPGAASVAHNVSKSLSHIFDVTFCWASSDNPGQYMQTSKFSSGEEFLQDGSIFQNVGAKGNSKSNFLGKVWIVYSLCTYLIRNNQNVVWFHSIGHKFPRISIALVKLLGYPVILTLHDYTWLTFKKTKLYPELLQNGTDIDSRGIIPLKSAKLLKSKGINFRTVSATLVLKYHKRLSDLVDEIICISHQQHSIYVANGFQVKHVVANYVSNCNCIFKESGLPDKTNVLFAGRSIGKGLELIFDVVANNPQFHLHLAGGVELATRARNVLHSQDYTFHGQLNQTEMAKLLHKVDVVICFSQCFDVFPTIVLEALSHETAVIVSNTCGNFPIVSKVCSNSVIPHGERLTESRIKSVIDDFPHSSTNYKLILPEEISIVKQLCQIINGINSRE